jgi:hypothetical protein
MLGMHFLLQRVGRGIRTPAEYLRVSPFSLANRANQRVIGARGLDTSYVEACGAPFSRA